MTAVASGFENITGSWGDAQLDFVREAIVLVGQQSLPKMTEPGHGFYFGVTPDNSLKDSPGVVEWSYDGYEVKTTGTYPASNWLLLLDMWSSPGDRILGGHSYKANAMANLCVALAGVKEHVRENNR